MWLVLKTNKSFLISRVKLSHIVIFIRELCETIILYQSISLMTYFICLFIDEWHWQCACQILESSIMLVQLCNLRWLNGYLNITVGPADRRIWSQEWLASSQLAISCLCTSGSSQICPSEALDIDAVTWQDQKWAYSKKETQSCTESLKYVARK